MPETILVTGATGAQGSALVPELIKCGFRVRAMTRNIGKPSALALKALGAQLVAADLDDEGSLERACEGVYGVFAVQNFWERGVGFQGEIDQGCRLARAAKKQGVSHFVQTSVSNCEHAQGVLHFQSKYEIEKYVDQLQLPRTFLREVFFMENFLEPVVGFSGKKPLSPRIVLAMMAGALKPDTRFHMVAVEDIAWFAAEVFSNPEQYLGTSLDVASDVLTVDEMKAVYRKVTGKRPLPFAIPMFLLRLSNAEAARQYDWNNRQGWSFDIEPLRQKKPDLVTFEAFLRRRLAG
ncbi:MAG: NmrA/HSCARG family protein [Alcanivoracaceae bacterium]|nr:NmrA/HSCARG family protein [Alcanivoracaceae bacterium]